MVTVNEQLALLPDGSVAVQVTVFVPLANVEPEAGTQAMDGLVVQLSVALAVKVMLLREHWPASVVWTMLDGQVMTGASTSRTTTVCAQVLLLWLVSITSQVTVLVPIGKLAGASLVTVATAQLSAVVGVPRVTLVDVHWPSSALTVTLLGQTIIGNSVSRTVTLNVQPLVLPEPSV